MSIHPLLVICDLLVLAGLFLLGAMVVLAVLGRADRLLLLSLSLGVGAGLFSWSMFLVSWAGLPLNAATLLGLYAVLGVVAALLARRASRMSPVNNPSLDSPVGKLDSWLTRCCWILIALLILGAAILAVGLSYFGWDDIANWALKGYGIALEGSIFAGRQWGSIGLSYPMNLTLIIAVFRIFGGNLLPGSKLLYPVFYAALLLGCYRFWVMHGLKRWVASVCALALATTPIIFTHAYMGYANLATTFYLIMGLMLCLNSMEVRGTREAVLGGILLAMGLWTRPEGFVMCIAVLSALGLGSMLRRGPSFHWLAALIPLAIVGGSWFIFLKTQAASDTASYGLIGMAWRGILAGQIHWSALYTILRFIAGQVLRFRDWGLLPLLAGGLAVLGLRWTRLRRDIAYTTLLFATLMIGLAMIGFQYVVAYAPADPGYVYTWLSLEFTRVAMPAGVSLALLGSLFFQEKELERREGTADAGIVSPAGHEAGPP